MVINQAPKKQTVPKPNSTVGGCNRTLAQIKRRRIQRDDQGRQSLDRFLFSALHSLTQHQPEALGPDIRPPLQL
jgi:hypothetical protein